MLDDLAFRLKKRTIVMPSGCHEWQGYVMKKAGGLGGYGQIGYLGKVIYTHRAAWLIAYSDPGEMYVLHECDNRRCVNPKHLFLGTHHDNMADRQRKGRTAHSEKSGPAKLTAEQASAIRASTDRTTDLAKRYDVAPATITHIRNGKNWLYI